jgi:VIT1/CCC1 family predicted Fe2+/Mn2+ transporter
MGRSQKPKTGTSIFLYIFGVALVIVAVIVLLKGLGVLANIPNFVIIALALITVGIGIIGGLRNAS